MIPFVSFYVSCTLFLSANSASPILISNAASISSIFRLLRHQFIISPIEQHSKKPDIARDKIVELAGNLPRIELLLGK